MVLPEAGTLHADNQERTREALAIQQQNLCRWLVRLSSTGDAITITDLAGPSQNVSWDVVTDQPTLSDAGVAQWRDDNSYYIDARGYASGDRLHHDVSAQLAIGEAVRLLREDIYGAGAIPPQANLVPYILPIFYQLPKMQSQSETTASLSFIASESGTIHIGAWPLGSQPPSAAAIIVGTGALSKSTATAGKRTSNNVALTALPQGQSFDLYAVVETSVGVSVVSSQTGIAPWTPNVPAAFTPGDWGLTDTAVGGILAVEILSLPANGGSQITSIEYQVDGGGVAIKCGDGKFPDCRIGR